LTACTGTTNRSPSAEATSPPPHSCATPIEACASTSRALAAYEADPDLAALRLDFTETLGEVVEVMSAGLLARGGRNDR
jgi:hypothetical protein